MIDYAARRHLMIEAQLRPSAIEDERVLHAMGAVPREAFLPQGLKGVAYGDEDIQLGDGRRLIEPLVLGKLLQPAAIGASGTALVIGCDTGYCAAVLSRMVTKVVFLGGDADRFAHAERMFAFLACEHVLAVRGDAAEGHLPHAPYDLILIAGAVRVIPEHLKAQLAEGGRLVTILSQGRAGKIAVVTRVGGAFGMITPFDAAAPEVVELRPASHFSF